MKANPFEEIIGQETAKRKLNFFIEGYKSTNIVPHFMLVAEKGAGKSSLGIALGKCLVPKNKDKFKPLHLINCASIKSLPRFINNTILTMDATLKEMTFFFDEASEIPRDVTMALLTILNPTALHCNEYNHDGQRLIFDFRKLSFIFATTESQKVYEPLMSRLERIDLEPYTIEELGKIILKNAPQSRFESQELLDNISGVVRSNPRQAAKLGDYINTYVMRQRISPFGFKDWRRLKYTLGIMPLGLSKIEVEIMKILNQSPHTKLGHIAAKVGLSSDTIRRDFERFLLRNNLIKVEPDGRLLTDYGRNILQQIK